MLKRNEDCQKMMDFEGWNALHLWYHKRSNYLSASLEKNKMFSSQVHDDVNKEWRC
jgi:hypothetical protein